MKANEHQVGGDHYAEKQPYQHWDFVFDAGLGYMEAQITKYISRHRYKGGKQDVQKARHFIDKLIEQIIISNAPNRELTDTARRATMDFLTRNRYQGDDSMGILYAATWRTAEELKLAGHHVDMLIAKYPDADMQFGEAK